MGCLTALGHGPRGCFWKAVVAPLPRPTIILDPGEGGGAGWMGPPDAPPPPGDTAEVFVGPRPEAGFFGHFPTFFNRVFFGPRIDPPRCGSSRPPPPGGQGVPPWAGGGLPGLKKKSVSLRHTNSAFCTLQGWSGLFGGGASLRGRPGRWDSPLPQRRRRRPQLPQPQPPRAPCPALLVCQGLVRLGGGVTPPPRALKSHISLKLKLLYSPMRSITMTTLSPK